MVSVVDGAAACCMFNVGVVVVLVFNSVCVCVDIVIIIEVHNWKRPGRYGFILFLDYGPKSGGTLSHTGFPHRARVGESSTVVVGFQ